MSTQVALESWQVNLWNRWAYVQVGEVVETVPVPPADGPAWELARGTVDLDDLVEPLVEEA